MALGTVSTAIRQHGRRTLQCFCVVAALLCATSFAFAQEDVATIIQKSVEANRRDWQAMPKFDNREEDRSPQGSKTYEDTMIEGSPYQRLIAVNGKNLSGKAKAAEQKKYEHAIASRRAESSRKRAQRIAKYKADRRRDNIMLQQLTKAFDFKMAGEQELDGRKVFVLKATPRQGYRPPNRDSQVLTGTQGTLWIDQQTYQWVKVEAHVTRPVSIEGFVAKVEPGTKFELEKTPVDGDIWLPKRYTMKASAKVFDVIPHHSQEDDTYFDYRKRGMSSDGSNDKEQSAESGP